MSTVFALLLMCSPSPGPFEYSTFRQTTNDGNPLTLQAYASRRGWERVARPISDLERSARKHQAPDVMVAALDERAVHGVSGGVKLHRIGD